MKTIRVKPVGDHEIKDRNGKVIPARGAEVDKTVEIIRHIREGALEVAKTLPKKPKKKDDKTEESKEE